MAWADLDDVVALVGEGQVTQAHIDLAQTMIEILAGATETASDNELVSSRNLRLLSSAVSFQAIWIAAHPDVLTVMDTSSVSQDGLSAQWMHAHAHLLAPMAYRCINRLTWKMDPLRIQRKNKIYSDDFAPRDSAVHDDQYVWSPL